MDSHAIVAHPLTAVFAHLATPERLGDWLPEVLHVEMGDDLLCDAGSTFEAILQVDGVQLPARGEIIALEPPAIVGYRLFVGDVAAVVRVSGVACEVGTHVRVSLAGDGMPLVIDLDRLDRAMTVLPPANEGRDLLADGEERSAWGRIYRGKQSDTAKERMDNP